MTSQYSQLAWDFWGGPLNCVHIFILCFQTNNHHWPHYYIRNSGLSGWMMPCSLGHNLFWHKPAVHNSQILRFLMLKLNFAAISEWYLNTPCYLTCLNCDSYASWYKNLCRYQQQMVHSNYFLFFIFCKLQHLSQPNLSSSVSSPSDTLLPWLL